METKTESFNGGFLEERLEVISFLFSALFDSYHGQL